MVLAASAALGLKIYQSTFLCTCYVSIENAFFDIMLPYCRADGAGGERGARADDKSLHLPVHTSE